MSNKESRRYKHDIKRVGDLAERPVEMFKREYDDKTSLVLKSRNIPENEIFVNINGINSVNPIYINTNVIPFQMSIDLDLSKSKYHYIKLEDDLFINDIINFENGIEYKFYVSQDEVGSHNITFGNDINGLFKEFGLNLEPNTTTLIKITPINNVLYILFDTNSREIPFNIKSFTPLNNSENININQNTLTATFTKEIVFGIGDISIKRFSDDSIFQTFVVDNEVTDADLVINGNTLTINALDFEYDEQYYITISNGSIESFDGITFAGISDKNTWTFKTVIPFTFTIDTTLGIGDSFNLPLRQYRKDFETNQYTIANNYDLLVDWGDGSSDVITSYNQAEKNHTYISGGTYEIKVSGLCESWGFYDEQIDGYVSTDNNKITNVIEWGYIGIIDASAMFDLCENINELNGGDIWCKNVNNMDYMFIDSTITTLNVPNWNVSNVNYMRNMFDGCSSLTTLDVSNWDVSNVKSMMYMFRYCESLTTLDVSKWDVSNVTNMNRVFTNATIDTASYDALLIGWSQLPSLQPNLTFGANLAKYQSLEASKARQHIIDTYGWTIVDAGQTDAFEFTIDTTLGTGDSFDLPLRSGYNYDMLVDWGDGETSEVKSFDDINKTHTYATGGEYQVKISGLCESWYFNNGGDRLKLTSINQWGNTGFINMANAFRGCNRLTTINDTDGTWCSNVTDMSSMFSRCTSLITLNVSTWNTIAVTNMGGMFGNCTSLEILDVSGWNVSGVTNMGSMFSSCFLETLDVSGWNTSAVTNMYSMFSNCAALTTLDVSNWNTSAVTDISYMFSDCFSLTTLDVSDWDVSNVTNMSRMFYDTPLDTPSYDALLIGWSELPSLKSNVKLDANQAKYSSGAAATARGILTSAPNNWTINDGGQVV